MPFSAQNITITFFVEIQRFIKIVVWALFKLSYEHFFVESALSELSNQHFRGCRISTFCCLSTLGKWASETFFIGFFYRTNYSRFAFFHLAGVHPSFSENNLIKLLRERKPEDSASFCILISGCSFSMFFAYSNRRPVIHSRNVILYVVLI